MSTYKQFRAFDVICKIQSSNLSKVRVVTQEIEYILKKVWLKISKRNYTAGVAIFKSAYDIIIVNNKINSLYTKLDNCVIYTYNVLMQNED